MEEENESEQNSGSPSSGESEFVHVKSIDTTTLINQDDGVVVTRVDSGQDELTDVRITEDAGNEEFLDCPDDLLSYDGRSDVDETRETDLVLEHQQMFMESTEDNRRSLFDSEKDVLPHHYQEERRQLMTELTNLRHQLKPLIKKHPLIAQNVGGLLTDELASVLPLHEMINNCSKFIELAVSEQSQTDSTIEELYATVDTKDRQINDLNIKVIEVYSIENTADRILSSFATVIGEEEFPDTSVSGKMSHLEKNTSFLIQKYNYFISGVEMLNQCLTEVKPDYQSQFDMDKVLVSVRDELVSLKQKEFELAHKSSYLEIEYGKLMQQLEKSRKTFEMLNTEIGNLKGEVEVQKNKFSNTKEKLNMAVTKGKSLVQQRDSLKQVIMEKTDELDKCFLELQEKSTSLEAANLQIEALLQRDTVLKKCEEVLSLCEVGEEFQSLDIVDKVTWLANERSGFLDSFNMAKYESAKLQDEINTMKEAARGEIDRLTVSLLVESQEKSYLEEEFADLTHKYEELCVLKDKYASLQADLQRSEDKSASLREKLSMAVKKGKGLVQERTEKNAQIDALKLELKQKEATVNDLKDQISKLSKDVEQIEKLESDLLRSKEEKDQIEQFLVESNTLLQSVIEAIDNIVVPIDLTEPVEKVKWCATYLNECQVAKDKAEQELGDVKDEAGRLTSKLTDALTTMKSLEDLLSVSEKHVFQLTEEKTELEVLKTKTEEELRKAMEDHHVSKSQAEQEVNDLQEEVAKLNDKLKEVMTTMKSLEDVLSVSEKTITQLTAEKQQLEESKSYVEERLHKSLEEATSQTSMLQEIVASKNTLQEALSLAEKNISVLTSEKKHAEMELQKVKDELSAHVINLDEAQKIIKSFEDTLSQEVVASKNSLQEALLLAEKNISVLTSEKKDAEMELQKVKDELSAHVINLDEAQKTIMAFEDTLSQEVVASKNALQEALSVAENNISVLTSEKEDAETELQKVKDEVSKHVINLDEAHKTIKSLEDTLSQEVVTSTNTLQEALSLAEKNISVLTSEKNDAEMELQKVKDEVSKHVINLDEAHKTIKSLEDTLSQEVVASKNALQEALSVAKSNISVLTCKKEDAEMELQKVKDEVSTHVLNLDEAHKTIKSLEDALSELHTHVSQFSNENEKAVVDRSLLENELKQLKEEAACHEQKFTDASATIITLEEALLKAENTISDLIEEKKNAEKIVNTLQNDKQVQEKRVAMLGHDIKVLRSACTDVTKEMKFLVENNVLEKLNYNPSSNIGAVDDVAEADIKVVEEMLSASRNVRSVIEQCVDVKQNMSTTIKELQAELVKTRSMFDEVKEENTEFENRVLKLDTELEDYREKEDEWHKREAELSKQITAFMKDHEARKDLLSASEVQSLFNKINGITIPFPNVGEEDIEAHESNSTKKLFYIVDSITELLDQITLLSHSNENLHSTLSKQALEIEHLNEELEVAIKDRKEFEKIKKELFDLSVGFENFILKFGGEKPADVAGLFPVLEKLIYNIVLDSENSKAKLLETEKVAEELANKVKLLEDLGQSQSLMERDDTESSSLLSQSEISEVEDPVSVGKRATPLVRTLRRETNDYLSVNIDSESDQYIDKQETIEDKGHIFKSLHTSGLVPPKGKIVADRFDGIWVSGSRALMSRPRARLGLIAYWVVLHLWLLGSLL